jgi:probable selenium-dependent hydroxylase accessory protein YqeC
VTDPVPTPSHPPAVRTAATARGALGIGRGDVVALVGAGGKTTLLHRVAAEARASGLRVLATTTTHTASAPEELTGPVVFEEDGDPEASLLEALHRHGRATLLGRRIRPDKLEGPRPERVDAVHEAADLVLVEADGARGRSLKAPAPHEPVLPASTTVLVVLVGLDALGCPLDAVRVHRLEILAAAVGRAVGETIDEDLVAAALLHPLGYLSRVPPGARTAVFLNKAETAPALAAAERLARRLREGYGLVAAGAARGGEVRVFADLLS